MSTEASVRRGRRRPYLPEMAKYIRLRQSMFELWWERKLELGLQGATDSSLYPVFFNYVQKIEGECENEAYTTWESTMDVVDVECTLNLTLLNYSFHYKKVFFFLLLN